MDRTSKPSAFIEIISWIALIASGTFLTVGILQVAVVWLLFPSGFTASQSSAAEGRFISTILNYFPWFVTAFSVFWALVFWAALAFRGRRKWAHHALVGLCYSGAIGAVTVALITVIGGADEARPSGISQTSLALAGSALAAIGAAAFVWIAWKLSSQPIRDEFV